MFFKWYLHILWIGICHTATPWIRIVLMRIRIQLKILIWIRIRIQIRGAGGRSAKNVHPPWQNPRYAPAHSALRHLTTVACERQLLSLCTECTVPRLSCLCYYPYLLYQIVLVTFPPLFQIQIHWSLWIRIHNENPDWESGSGRNFMFSFGEREASTVAWKLVIEVKI